MLFRVPIIQLMTANLALLFQSFDFFSIGRILFCYCLFFFLSFFLFRSFPPFSSLSSLPLSFLFDLLFPFPPPLTQVITLHIHLPLTLPSPPLSLSLTRSLSHFYLSSLGIFHWQINIWLRISSFHLLLVFSPVINVTVMSLNCLPETYKNLLRSINNNSTKKTLIRFLHHSFNVEFYACIFNLSSFLKSQSIYHEKLYSKLSCQYDWLFAH